MTSYRLRPVAVVCLLLVFVGAVTSCGDDDTTLPFPGRATATLASPSTANATGAASNQTLIDQLLQASFPSLRLTEPTSRFDSGLRNGPELSDQQLAAGVLGEVSIDLGGRDSASSIAFDVLPNATAAAAWYQRFSLGLYPQFKVHGSYSPKGIGSAKCEQFADISAGRNSGGTQCFALDKSVVVFGESIVYDTPSGNQQDAENMLKAALAYLDTLKH